MCWPKLTTRWHHGIITLPLIVSSTTPTNHNSITKAPLHRRKHQPMRPLSRFIYRRQPVVSCLDREVEHMATAACSLSGPQFFETPLKNLQGIHRNRNPFEKWILKPIWQHEIQSILTMKNLPKIWQSFVWKQDINPLSKKIQFISNLITDPSVGYLNIITT